MSDYLNKVKEFVHGWISKRIPGLISFLNILCSLNFGSDCKDLLFTSPSSLYTLMIQYYRGDSRSADYTFQMAFLNPIAMYFNKPDLAGKLMELVKTGNDREFNELIRKNLEEK